MNNNIELLKALGDESRMKIIEELHDGEKCACVLLQDLNISQSTLSHHMKILSDLDIVNCRKEGKWCHYSLNNEILTALSKDINSLKQKPGYYDEVIMLCLKEKSKNPIDIFNRLVSLPYFGMMGVFHHFLVAMALLTAYKNCGNAINLESGLIEIQERAKNVPPMACMKLGSCGAAVSTGIFISVASGVGLESNKFFGLANGMTAKVLEKIKETGGPRCCKRHSYFALIAAVDYCNENFGTNMETSEIKCIRSSENNLCIGKRCPFNIL